jgi:hypothetical protein
MDAFRIHVGLAAAVGDFIEAFADQLEPYVLKVGHDGKDAMAAVTDKIPSRSPDWIQRLGSFWCRHAHSAVMWPIHGRYQCRICGRQFPVPFDTRAEASSLREPQTQSAKAIWGSHIVRRLAGTS